MLAWTEPMGRDKTRKIREDAARRIEEAFILGNIPEVIKEIRAEFEGESKREWNPLDSPETERFTWRCLWCGHTKEETFITEMGNRGFRCPNCKMQHYMNVDKKSSGVPFLRSLEINDYKLDKEDAVDG